MNHNDVISLQVKDSTTISAHRRVKVTTGGVVEPAGATDTWIGSNLQDADSSVTGRNIAAVRLKANGIDYATYGTSTALAAGDEIVGSANGKITKGSSSPIGVALQAATADGDIIRVIYY